MLVDASALVAIILKEADASELLDKIGEADRPVMTVVNAVEAALAVGQFLGNYERGAQLVLDGLDRIGARMIGVDPDLYTLTMKAYAAYGKGTGHKARLNFGDCFSYAMAKRLGTSLLYKGNDFAHTDLARG